MAARRERKPGRPRKQVSAVQVLKLAKLSCTMEEIAYVVGCSVDTLQRNFADVVRTGHAHCKMSLRRKLVSDALRKNAAPAVLIFANKVITGLRENDAPVDPDAPARTRGAVIHVYRTDGDEGVSAAIPPAN